jgi:hypothetical protein
VQQLGHVRPGERHPDQHPAVLVHDERSASPVAVAVHRRPGDRDVQLHHAGAQAGVGGVRGGASHPGHLRVGEHDLRDSGRVGGQRVRRPRRGVVRQLAAGPAGDDRTDDAGLVLALVGQRGPAVDVTHGIEPAAVDPAHQPLVVDAEGVTGGETHGLDPEVAGRGPPPGRHQQPGRLERCAVVERDPYRLVGPAVDGLHALGLGAQVQGDALLAQRLGHQRAGERLCPYQ